LRRAFVTFSLMAIEATIAGEGFRLLLRVHGYERSSLTSGSDANWLTAEAELTASTSYRARETVSLRTDELAAFRDQLARLVDTLEGEATLHHLEDQVGCTVSLRAGSGEVTAFVRQKLSEPSSASPRCGPTSPTCSTPSATSTPSFAASP
jgi:hypothetical protein